MALGAGLLIALALVIGSLLARASAQPAELTIPAEVERINALLPQTQCGQCGYPGCRPYAEALLLGTAEIDQCPPGGEATARALGDAARQPQHRAHAADAGGRRRRHRRACVHRLHALCRGLPGRCDHRRRPVQPYGDRCRLHRLRAVHTGLPGRLHPARCRPGASNAGICAMSASATWNPQPRRPLWGVRTPRRKSLATQTAILVRHRHLHG